MHSTHDSADEPGDTPPEKPRGVVAYVGPASNSSEDSADCMSANDLNDELQNDSNDNLQVQSTGSLSNEGNTIKPQVDQNLEGKDALIEHKAPATEARIKKPPLGGDSDTIGTTGASTEPRVIGGSRRISNDQSFAKKRPMIRAPSRRFDLAHQHIFDSQPSIERYGRTPNKTGAKFTTSIGRRPAVSSVRATPAEDKPAAKVPVPPGTLARCVAPSIGSGINPPTKGVTVASKPCTLVVQPSKKKPTQVKEFSLSSNRKREGFSFKPYTGPVPPVTPVVSALTDKTAYFSSGRRNGSARGPTNSSKVSHQPVQAIGIKDKLASGRAQSARRAAHKHSGKVLRGQKIAQTRESRA
ncbi:unnamed protein product [Ascophyllum nodosum]